MIWLGSGSRSTWLWWGRQRGLADKHLFWPPQTAELFQSLRNNICVYLNDWHMAGYCQWKYIIFFWQQIRLEYFPRSTYQHSLLCRQNVRRWRDLPGENIQSWLPKTRGWKSPEVSLKTGRFVGTNTAGDGATSRKKIYGFGWSLTNDTYLLFVETSLNKRGSVEFSCVALDAGCWSLADSISKVTTLLLLGEQHWVEPLENAHRLTSNALLWKNTTWVPHKEIHSPVALNNINKSSKGPCSQPRGTAKVSFFTPCYNLLTYWQWKRD